MFLKGLKIKYCQIISSWEGTTNTRDVELPQNLCEVTENKTLALSAEKSSGWYPA